MALCLKVTIFSIIDTENQPQRKAGIKNEMRWWPLSAVVTTINQAANSHQLAGQNSLQTEVTALLFVFDWGLSHLNKCSCTGTNHMFQTEIQEYYSSILLRTKVIWHTDQLNLIVFCLEYNADQFVLLLSRPIFCSLIQMLCWWLVLNIIARFTALTNQHCFIYSSLLVPEVHAADLHLILNLLHFNK